MKAGICLLAPGSWERWSAWFAARGKELPAIYSRQEHTPRIEPKFPVPIHGLDVNRDRVRPAKQHLVVRKWE